MVNEQNEPVQDGATEAGTDEKITGLVQQVTADSAGRSREEIAALVVQRFGDAGMPLDDETLASVVERISGRQE